MAEVSIRTDARRRLVLVTWRGVCQQHEFAPVIQQISGLIRNDWGVLADFTSAQANISFNTNTKIATQRAADPHPTAIVAADPVTFGSLNQYSRLVDSRGGGSIAVFSCMDDALAWLHEQLAPPSKARTKRAAPKHPRTRRSRRSSR